MDHHGRPPIIFKGEHHGFRVTEANIMIWNGHSVKDGVERVEKVHQPIFDFSQPREGEDAMGVVYANRVIMKILLEGEAVFARQNPEQQEILPDGLEGTPGNLEVHFEPIDTARRVLTQFNKLRIATLIGFKLQGDSQQLMHRRV